MDSRYGDFDELYRAHSNRLVLQLLAHTGDLQVARDVVQEAFCRALTRWTRISRYDDPIGWVRRVAWNLASTHRYKVRRRQEIARALPPPEAPEPGPDRVALTRALASLPVGQRRAVIMFYLGGLPLRAIAETEQISENTVKQRLHRARTSLAARLSDRVPGVGNV